MSVPFPSKSAAWFSFANVNPSTNFKTRFKSGQVKFTKISKNAEKQVVPCESTAEDASYDWSHFKAVFTLYQRKALDATLISYSV